jgi:hypothetical protein
MTKTSHPLGFLRAQLAFAVATLAALDGIPGALSISTYRRINDSVEDMKTELEFLELQFEADTGAGSEDTADSVEGKSDTDKPVKRAGRGAAKEVDPATESEQAPDADDTKPLFDEDTKA